ncbi:MAG: hypothetical protein AAF676_01190 [Pseudomonadota bacterium]
MALRGRGPICQVMALKLAQTFAALFSALAATASAEPRDAADPLAPRWGADAATLDQTLPGLRRADPPVAFGAGLSAPRALQATTAYGGLWRAWFQVDGEGRLVQILLDRRRAALRPGDGARTLRALSAAHGPPLRLCRDAARAGGVQTEALWLTETARITLGAINADPRPSAHEVTRAQGLSALRSGKVDKALRLRRALPPPGAERRARPRRLLLRLTDPARPDLAGLCPPVPIAKPRPAAAAP